MQHQRAYLFSWNSAWNTWQLHIRNLVVIFRIGIVEVDQRNTGSIALNITRTLLLRSSDYSCAPMSSFWNAVIWLRSHDGRATNLFRENGATIVYTTIYLHIYCNYLRVKPEIKASVLASLFRIQLNFAPFPK